MAQSQTPWPKRGVAGQVQPAKRSAPKGAHPLQVLAVAHAAYERGEDPAAIWAEVR